MMDAYDREEAAICEAEERGEISREEANRELSELAREYRAMAEEAAQRAYDERIQDFY
jgi:polyhydroxyalkanoate synthesis regulator phasin